MAINIGIVGLPNVGKSTLFNALSSAGAESANFPFCTISPNVGVVPVPDERLDALQRLYASKRVIPTSLEFVDIAGLVRGASKGEGLGNQFLGHIREVDAIAQVVRCFDDENVVHVEGAVDPRRDVDVIDTELIYRDLETVDKRIDRATKTSRAAGAQGVAGRAELEILRTLQAHLHQGRAARTLMAGAGALGEDGRALLREFCLLTAKPMFYVGNIHEEHIKAPTQSPGFVALQKLAEEQGLEAIAISAEIESQVAQLPAAERQDYLQALGLDNPGLHLVIHQGYQLLDLITYLTAGPEEVRAWTVSKGTLAPAAAGVIHTDFARGFIKAEVIPWGELVALGSEAAARQAGKLRIEGKEYVVQDGDVMHFRFNV